MQSMGRATSFRLLFCPGQPLRCCTGMKRRNEVAYMATPHSIDPLHHGFQRFLGKSAEMRRSTKTSSRVRCGACRMPLPQRLRNWIPFPSSKRPRSWDLIWSACRGLDRRAPYTDRPAGSGLLTGSQASCLQFAAKRRRIAVVGRFPVSFRGTRTSRPPGSRTMGGLPCS